MQPPAPAVEEPVRLTVAEHLEELRRRLAVCLLAVLLTSAVAMRYAAEIVTWLKRPAGDLLPTLAFLGPADAVVAHLKVAVVCGLACAVPVLLYQAWAFVRPGLKASERGQAVVVAAAGSALFAAGVAIGYRWLLPALLRFLLGFGGPELQPVITIGKYVAFVLTVLMTCGVVCEMPLAIVMLVRVGIVSPRALRRQRGLAVVVMLVAAAVLSPTTDALSLLLFAVPLWLLYEASILLASWTSRRG